MKNRKNIEDKYCFGEEIIENGFTVDVYGTSINPYNQYRVIINHNKKKIRIISEKDDNDLILYEIENDIDKIGLESFLNSGIRMGFIENYEQYYTIIENIINLLVVNEFYERADKLNKEFNNLKLKESER
jgi:hypothetical protein